MSESGREKMSPDAVAAAAAELKGWKVEEDGRRIVRSYLFPTFPQAVAFVNRVAETAERMNHHPFIAIDYRRVTLRLTTWSAGGLTALDFESAAVYDEQARAGQ